MINKTINAVIKIVGSQQKLVNAYGVKQPSVWAWLHGRKKVSVESAKRIELVIEGSVPAYQTRPDLPDLFPYPNRVT